MRIFALPSICVRSYERLIMPGCCVEHRSEVTRMNFPVLLRLRNAYQALAVILLNCFLLFVIANLVAQEANSGRGALLIAADGEGIAISKRRITLSTSGVVPNIARTGVEIGCMLAVSLHAVRDELRNELVPLNRKYPLNQLLDACRNYPGLSNARRITFEYVMLKDVNDSLGEAKALVKLLAGIPAKINLIPFNPWPGSKYECSEWEQIEKFSEIIFNAGYASPVRTPRGRDILAACGQLKSASEKLSARERLALRAMAMTD